MNLEKQQLEINITTQIDIFIQKFPVKLSYVLRVTIICA